MELTSLQIFTGSREFIQGWKLNITTIFYVEPAVHPGLKTNDHYTFLHDVNLIWKPRRVHLPLSIFPRLPVVSRVGWGRGSTPQGLLPPLNHARSSRGICTIRSLPPISRIVRRGQPEVGPPSHKWGQPAKEEELLGISQRPTTTEWSNSWRLHHQKLNVYTYNTVRLKFTFVLCWIHASWYFYHFLKLKCILNFIDRI